MGRDRKQRLQASIVVGRFAVVQGFTLRGFGGSVQASGNAGVLWFERCSLQPQAGLSSFGATLLDSDAVVWSQCFLQNQASVAFPPEPALLSASSRVHLFDAEVRQLARQRGMPAPPPALQVVGSFLEVFGAQVLGRNGLDGNSTSCPGQGGGDGLVLQYSLAPSTAVILDSVLQGGSGGAGFGGCSDGQDGEGLVVGAGSSATMLAGTARSLSVSSPVREDESLSATLTGKPGDRVWLRYATRPGTGAASPFLDGELVLGAPSAGVFLGTIPASGSLVVVAAAPDLATGVESQTLFAQALFRDVGTGRFVVRLRAPRSCSTRLSNTLRVRKARRASHALGGVRLASRVPRTAATVPPENGDVNLGLRPARRVIVRTSALAAGAR